MADFAGLRLLIFTVADLACATRAESVREIIPWQSAVRIPGAPTPVMGLINVRGRLMTLVDGRHALHHQAAEDEGPIILLDVGTQTVGFVVDSVVDLFSVTPSDLAERADLPGVDARLVRAVGRRDDVSFVLLDLDALLRPIL